MLRGCLFSGLRVRLVTFVVVGHDSSRKTVLLFPGTFGQGHPGRLGVLEALVDEPGLAGYLPVNRAIPKERRVGLEQCTNTLTGQPRSRTLDRERDQGRFSSSEPAQGPLFRLSRGEHEVQSLERLP